MSLRALFYAYVLGGLTFIPLLIFALLSISIYTSVPAPAPVPAKNVPPEPTHRRGPSDTSTPSDANDLPRTRKAWLTVRRTFEESSDTSYVTLVKSYLDSRSKDPKRSRPKDTWYVVLKGKVMYLYEDEAMTECEAAVELGGHDVVVYPEGLPDGELFTRRNAICLKPRSSPAEQSMPNEVPLGETEHSDQDNKDREPAPVAPWFIFVRSCVDMEDWYLALVHASGHTPGTPTLSTLKPVFLPSDMNSLVATLDEQPDVIPMRWFNALLGRLFYSFYRTQMLESYIIGRLMKKLSRVKRPAFLTDIAVTQFSVGNKAPTFSKPMLKELTKEGDASLEVGLSYKGEIRATVEATAVISLGAPFKSYTVKLVLAVMFHELEGNLLVRVKRPPSSRIWYAFTKPPRMVIHVEPIVSDRQITWSMILNSIEAKIEEIIIDSVVLPNMDDISFFDSLEYEHRGGVWADAARAEKSMTEEAMTKPVASTAGPLSPHTEQEPAAEPSQQDSVPVIRTATALSDKTLTTVRRRSWFFSGPDFELDGKHTREAEDDIRGQSTGSDGCLAPPPDTSPMQPLDASENGQDAHRDLPPRSSSANSYTHSRSSRAHSVSSSVGGDESSNYLSDTSATSNKNSRHSLNTTTASTFLSTLKSKAGDKQALSNTAREAMRKWGVNWGMKRENSGNASPDDLPDMGPSDHRVRTESTHDRQSYAEMRAAVIERREREQTDGVDGRTSPIPIPPRGGGERARSTSTSGGRSMHSSGPSSSGLSRSLGDVSNGPLKDRDFIEAAEENPAPSLIHTQPSQARTMTIPGIHASHRGEVMSMGNTAAALPAGESRPKGAAIQSMYRLWKSPILTGQQSQEPSTSPSTRHGNVNDGDHDVSPLSLAPEAVSPPSRVPPPLPPRTISSVAVRHPAESTHESPVIPTVSAASEALKSLASRDETRRQSVEVAVSADGEVGPPEVSVIPTTRTGSVKPPLPPRRTAM